VITPRLIGRITLIGPRADLKTVAAFPVAEPPDYPRLFAHDPETISHWLRTAIPSRRPHRHED